METKHRKCCGENVTLCPADKNCGKKYHNQFSHLSVSLVI